MRLLNAWIAADVRATGDWARTSRHCTERRRAHRNRVSAFDASEVASEDTVLGGRHPAAKALADQVGCVDLKLHRQDGGVGPIDL
ncbi:hypothetical protein M2302_006623 [Micromonospora sp. A200]|uniref:hypothetical protein n=1 Tax=Micromonospora sp. A200 TaxID=2940568 RepID=UPI002475FBA8|nr:hypothetical protein [Micromonospora sp. A200]MDH6466415.1 hypothetical protein [Micromonospora sp. A200]